MAEYHDLVSALTYLLVNKLQSQAEYTHGLLGDGQGHVQVPGRDDYSYVRPDRFSTRTYEVFNKLVGNGTDGLPVIVGELPWSPGLTQVLTVDWETYIGIGWGSATSGLPKHGPTHEWRDAAPGTDTFPVWRRQLGELSTHPLGSGSLSIYVTPYDYTYLEQVKSWPGVPGLDLSAAVPSATGTARLMLTYWNPHSGTSGYLGLTSGTLGVDAGPEVLNKPAAPIGTIPSAWVKLRGGQSSVTEFDIYDARPLWEPSTAYVTGTGVWAGLIPIADQGGFYTGTTVESALQEARWKPNVVVVSTSGRGDYTTLAAAVSANPGGAVILLDAETHNVTSQITLSSGNYTIVGLSREDTLISAEPATLFNHTGNNLSLTNLRINQQVASSGDVTAIASSGGAVSLYIENVRAVVQNIGSGDSYVINRSTAALGSVYIHSSILYAMAGAGTATALRVTPAGSLDVWYSWLYGDTAVNANTTTDLWYCHYDGLVTGTAINIYSFSTWQDWTPTITQNNSVAASIGHARYSIQGETVHMETRLNITGTGTAGQAIVIGGIPGGAQAANVGTYAQVGDGLVVDAGSSIHYHAAVTAQTANTLRFIRDGESSWVGITPNFALDNGDYITFQVTYEKA